MMQTLEARLDRWRRVIAARNGARANDALEDSIVAGVRAMALTRGLTVGKPVDARIEIFTSESLLRQLAPGMRVARCGAVRVVVYRGEARLERLMSGQDGALRWRTLAPGRWDGRRLVVRPGFDATAIGELERRLQPRLRGAA